MRYNPDCQSGFSCVFCDCLFVLDTSRPQRPDEMPGLDYHFVTVEEMNDGIQQHRFIEAGMYKEKLYGTSVEAVRLVAEYVSQQNGDFWEYSKKCPEHSSVCCRCLTGLSFCMLNCYLPSEVYWSWLYWALCCSGINITISIFYTWCFLCACV